MTEQEPASDIGMSILMKAFLSLLIGWGFQQLIFFVWDVIGWFYYADMRGVGLVVSFFMLTQTFLVMESGVSPLVKTSKYSHLSGKEKAAILAIAILMSCIMIWLALDSLRIWLLLGTPEQDIPTYLVVQYFLQ